MATQISVPDTPHVDGQRVLPPLPQGWWELVNVGEDKGFVKDKEMDKKTGEDQNF